MASEIESLLPHRAPFLFVERVLERGERSIRCEWNVSPEMDCFRGHYPGQPILPGVLLCEFAFQAGAILLGSGPEAGDKGIPVLARIEDARFKRMVEPGARLEVLVELVDRIANAAYLSAKVSEHDATVLRLRFTLATAGAAEEA